MRHLRIFALLIVGFASSHAAWGQGYPNKPVRIVVPFAAGSATDIVARLIAEELTNTFNQAYATGPRPPEMLREFAYSMHDASACAGSGVCTFSAGRIGASLDGELAIALAGDATIGRVGSMATRLYDTY